MPAALDIPWTIIQRKFEEGALPMELCKDYAIRRDTLCKRVVNKKWVTPQDDVRALYQEAKALEIKLQKRTSKRGRGPLYAESQGDRAEGQHSLMQTDALLRIISSPDAAVSISDIAENYKGKTAKKLFQILATTTIAPPKTWRDFELMDKIMRRTLGLDEGGSKSSTVVSLQIVNDRLRSASSGDIVEGEIIEATIIEDAPSIVDSVVESVMDASSDTDSHCES